MLTFAQAYAAVIVAPITVLLVAAIITGPPWTIALLGADVAIATWFWRLFAKPDWPRSGR